MNSICLEPCWSAGDGKDGRSGVEYVGREGRFLGKIGGDIVF